MISGDATSIHRVSTRDAKYVNISTDWMNQDIPRSGIKLRTRSEVHSYSQALNHREFSWTSSGRSIDL